MSNEDKNSYNNIPYYSFHQDHVHTISSQGFALPITTGHNYNHLDNLYNHHHPHHHQQPPPLQNPNTDHQFDHSSNHMCLQGEVAEYSTDLSNAFDLSCSSFDQVATNYDYSNSNDQLIVLGEAAAFATENPRTPNSSVSFSSQDVGVEEDSSKREKDLQQKVCGDHGKSKNVSKAKERQARFAFMTKSEVDNLEDGYRWRKYGQKAVKNSPFPRSYYRCTSQKCGVKKRIERSFEEPSTVITTYEGQHNHHSPATIRCSAAAAMLSGLTLPFPSNNNIFPHQMFFPSSSTNYYQAENNTDSTNQQQEQLLQLPDDHHYGLLMPRSSGSFPPQSEAMNKETHH